MQWLTYPIFKDIRHVRDIHDTIYMQFEYFITYQIIWATQKFLLGQIWPADRQLNYPAFPII